MKEERHVAVVASGSMSGVTLSPTAAYPPAQRPLTTRHRSHFQLLAPGGALDLQFGQKISSSVGRIPPFSASSVAVPVIQQMYNRNSFWKATMVTVCMPFASFLVIAATALLSVYKLCKRIMW